MAEQEVKKVETETPATTVAPASVPAETKKEAVEEKTAAAAPPPPVEKPAPAADDSKALVAVEKAEPESAPTKISGGSHDRDLALAELEKEKTLAFIKAWEDSEKAKVENKFVKKLSAVAAWESSKKAALEAQLKSYEEKLEEQKVAYAKKTEKKIDSLHMRAEFRRIGVDCAL